MDLNPIAEKFAHYGRRRAELLRIAQRALTNVAKLDAEFCAHQRSLVHTPTPPGFIPLTEATVALAVAPKDN